MAAIDRDAILAWLAACAQAMAENRDLLTALDAAIGDADHGANMDRGFRAVAAKLPALSGADIATILKAAGMTLLSTVGGAAGPLYGTFFLQAAQACAGKASLTAADWLAALEAGVAGVAMRGKAVAGDKTMLDALEPAADALREAVAAGAQLPDALQRSLEAARLGMASVTPLAARKGRASYLGERAAGHQDPGATSACLMLEAAVKTWSA
jgi:dihydroxyacetone kinase-like protein